MPNGLGHWQEPGTHSVLKRFSNCMPASFSLGPLLFVEVNAARDKFLAESDCCLDPFWSRPVKSKVKSHNLDFKEIMQQFWEVFRPVSLREEQCHRIQRSFAGGSESKARLVRFQRALSVIHTIRRSYENRGGRDLDSAVPKVVKKFKKLRKSNRFRRPNQKGSAMISFIAFHSKKSSGQSSTKKELVARWKAMSPQGKAVWKSRHDGVQGVKRNQLDMEAAWKDSAETNTMPSTAWGLGDDAFPLTPPRLDSFLKQFHGKDQGLSTLAELGDAPEIQEYITAVTSGSEK